MKKYTCPDCGAEFKATTREEILSILYNHYIKDHKEIITKASEAEKSAWMEDFEKKWSEAEEVVE